MLTAIATFNPLPGGFVTISNPDGSVISVQPDGSIQSRPTGTAGAWETARREGGVLVSYQPEAPNGPVFLFSLPIPHA